MANPKRIPFPNHDGDRTPALDSGHRSPLQGGISMKSKPKKPWLLAPPHEVPLLMLKLELCDGTERSYQYGHLCELRLIGKGRLQLYIYGFHKCLVTIDGRHLEELAERLATGTIKSIREMGTRTFNVPEDLPAIDKIEVEELTGLG